jgi:hypothetical protein
MQALGQAFGRLGSARRARVNGSGGREGQSLIESCIAIGLICLIFMGLLQISQLFAAREILHHAAARGARCKTVGFNRWMVTKSVRIASIPNAGRLTTPDFQNNDLALQSMVATLRPGELWDEVLEESEPSSQQYNLESGRIPDYMFSHNSARAGHVLDYEHWDSIHKTVDDDYDQIRVTTQQEYPLWVPLRATFYARSNATLQGEAELENHYSLYLDDRNW